MSTDKDHFPKKKSEAAQELERMFGSEEEQGLDLFQKQKLYLINGAYKKSEIFFKMFFDKCYRPDRYATICDKIDKFQNINEFRSLVILNFPNFPASSVRSLFFIYKSEDDKKVEK